MHEKQEARRLDTLYMLDRIDDSNPTKLKNHKTNWKRYQELLKAEVSYVIYKKIQIYM